MTRLEPFEIEVLRKKGKLRRVSKKVEYDGCPCEGTCCAMPHPFGGHDEFCDCDDGGSCDYNWVVGCRNCGKDCSCEV